MELFTKEKQESYENAKISYICKAKFQNKYVKDEKQFEIIVSIQGRKEVLRIAYLI